MAEETKETKTGTDEGKETKEQTGGAEKKEQNVDVEAIKKQALSDLFKQMGVEDSDSLKGIVDAYKQDQESKKTDLEKKDGELTKALGDLNAETKKRVMAEAKLAAMKLGADPDMVDDLVIVASAKVTKEKDIEAVIAEIKEGATGSKYFKSKEEEEEKETEKKKKKNVTRKRIQGEGKKEEKEEEEGKENKHEGSIAARLFANKKQKKSYYFQ